MVDADLVAAKLSDLAERVARVRRHAGDLATLSHDTDALDLVSFNLMLAVQICADIASHLIADEGWPAAKSLAQSFERLAEHGAIDEPTAEALGRAVGLRNVVAHGYSKVDVAAVHTASTAGLADLQAFARQIAAYCTAQPAPRH